jgi:hypothetical protein
VAAWTQYWHLFMISPPDALAEAVLRALRALLCRMLEGIAAKHPLIRNWRNWNTFLALTPVQQVQ